MALVAMASSNSSFNSDRPLNAKSKTIKITLSGRKEEGP